MNSGVERFINSTIYESTIDSCNFLKRSCYPILFTLHCECVFISDPFRRVTSSRGVTGAATAVWNQMSAPILTRIMQVSTYAYTQWKSFFFSNQLFYFHTYYLKDAAVFGKLDSEVTKTPLLQHDLGQMLLQVHVQNTRRYSKLTCCTLRPCSHVQTPKYTEIRPVQVLTLCQWWWAPWHAEWV